MRLPTSKLPAFALFAIASAYGASAWALPEYQASLFAKYPNAAAPLAGCVACHESPGGPLNPYGSAFLANGFAFTAALDALDSDGDGATNGAELTASPATNPGNPNSKPGAGTPPVTPPSPPPTPPTPPTPPNPPVNDGAMLYATHCAACHGALADSTKVGATVERMQTAIAGNVGGMGSLSMLSTTELQDIASALAPAAPAASLNYTGMWWNPAESGWGLNVNHQGDVVFATLFTYDLAGAPLWVMASARLQADGRTYSGDLYRVRGPAFNAQPFTPITAANLLKVGTMSLTFAAADSATLSYTYEGVAVSKAIVPQVFGTAAANCTGTTGSRTALTNYQDMWWNPAESGWGVNVVHQNATLFATLMTYDFTGNNLWLVMLAGTRQPDGSYLGDLYRASGPPFNAQPFTPITGANLVKVGTMRFTFSDGVTGTLAYTFNGIPVSKAITRQVFSSPVPACSSPVPPASPASDGPTLYANNCAACHGALASSAKGGATLARIQNAIAGNVGGMGYLSVLSTTQLQDIASALAAVTPPAPPQATDGPTLYANNCAACHGPLASSAKGGATLSRIQNAIAGNIGGMGFLSVLSTTQLQAIEAALASVTPPAPPPATDGPTLYANNCAACHGPLASSAKGGATVARMQSAIAGNVGGMGFLSVLSNAQLQAIEAALASVTPAPPAACGSCHAIPPQTGKHREEEHRSRSCSACHGPGYSSTTVNAATHQNGIKDLLASVGWDAKTRSCANSCHGRENW